MHICCLSFNFHAIYHKMDTTMFKRATLIALFALCLTLPVSAQSSFSGAFLSSYDAASDKIVQLADAFPEDKYDWRPSEGVRSVKEAVMHVASANYFFGSMLGASVPEGINPRELESSIESKEEAVKVLKQSIDFAHKAVDKLSAASLDEEIDLFGDKAPRLRLVLVVGEHANEHLGQLIAYARSTGVTPPWSN